jgi:hypothetical protein
VIVWYGFYINFKQILYYNKKHETYSIYKSICNWQPSNNFVILYSFYTNKDVQKHNENVFINTLGPTFIFTAMDIKHQSCPPSYKFSNDLNKIVGLHFRIHIKNIYVGWIMCQ